MKIENAVINILSGEVIVVIINNHIPLTMWECIGLGFEINWYFGK